MVKFGFGFYPRGTIDDTQQLVRLGETLGYDQVWIPDQTFFRDPFVVLTLAAIATKRIGLLLGVTNPYTRHPVQVARAIATVDEVSGGRVSLAYGAGNRKELLLPLGFEQTEAGVRCREAVMVTKRLLAGETVVYRSPTLVADGVRLMLPPRPEIPVYLAGRGGAILSAAGEVADGVIIGGLVTRAGLAYAIDAVRLGAQAKQRDWKQLDLISWFNCSITGNRNGITENLKANVAHIIGGAPSNVLETIGMVPERIRELKQVYGKSGPEGAASYVTRAEIDLFTICGTVDECVARIGTLLEMGVKQVGVLLSQPTIGEQKDFLTRFANHVIPKFR